jgi:hypothetical protein
VIGMRGGPTILPHSSCQPTITSPVASGRDLRILDYNGERAFRLFRLAELGTPILHEPNGA